MNEKNQTGEYSLEVFNSPDGLTIASVEITEYGMERINQNVAVEATSEGVLVKNYDNISDTVTGSQIKRAVPVEMIGFTDRCRERVKQSLYYYGYTPDIENDEEFEEVVTKVADKVVNAIDEWFNSDNSEIQSESQN